MIQDRVGLSGEKAGSDSAKIREVIFPCFILFYFFNLKLIFLIRILMCGLFYMFDVRIFQGKLKYSILNQWTLKKENNRQYFIYFATCNPFTPALREFFLKLWIIYTKKKFKKVFFFQSFVSLLIFLLLQQWNLCFCVTSVGFLNPTTFYVTGIASDFWGKTLICFVVRS